MPACGGARCVFNQDTTAKLIHNCWGKNQQSALGQFSIGRVGQFSISDTTQLAESCLSSLSTQTCNVTATCDVFKGYSKLLMPDGPAGYYELHGPDKSMNPGNGKLVSEAVTVWGKANKAIEKCTTI